jgi:hypothetical protein
VSSAWYKWREQCYFPIGFGAVLHWPSCSFMADMNLMLQANLTKRNQALLFLVLD